MVTGYRLLLAGREPDRRARSRDAQRKASHGYSLKMGQGSLSGMGPGPSFPDRSARVIQGHRQPTRYQPRPETDRMSLRALSSLAARVAIAVCSRYRGTDGYSERAGHREFSPIRPSPGTTFLGHSESYRQGCGM